MKVLVTGGAGYIGSVLSRQLLQKGYEVRVFDVLRFGGESLLGIYDHSNFEFIKGDIRDESDVIQAVDGADAVVHLAAIVGDPACAKEPDLAREVNLTASKNLFDICHRTKKVKRFIFASTCSNYGKMEGDGFINEESPLRPVSLYAELKVEFETYLLKSQTRSDFVPTSLRFATVYGLSPRMRFDLTVNEFTRDVALGKKLLIYGEQFWRPYCHVEDLARACILVLESEPSKVDHNVFGVGDTGENYQKKMLSEEIKNIVPKMQVEYVHKDEDPRDYRVDFSKIKNELNFRITKTVPDGIRAIYTAVSQGIIRDSESEKYRNS
ncbi:MAG: NAD-dependent epimerase/dehydratase family protein [Fidelibacterota bacterium]